jgi:RES domain-containing protein
MHDRSTVAEALRLREEEGLGAQRVAGRRNEKKVVTIYVSRKRDVAQMDEFVGAKA